MKIKNIRIGKEEYAMYAKTALLGTLSLKRDYQRNTLIGFGLAGGFHLLTAGIIAIFMALSASQVSDIPTIVINRTTDIIRPPTIKNDPDQIKVATPERAIPPAVGIPEPVPDDEAPEQINIATQDDLSKMVPDIPIDNLDGINIQVDTRSIIDELLPGPKDFVPYDVLPVQVSTVNPVYPALAMRAGVQGTVWLKSLVDKEGKVRDVIIVKDSNANAGFEEAAIDAAYKTTWKPALANGQPTAVWVTYKVEFVLRQ
jgi:TonB family protein